MSDYLGNLLKRSQKAATEVRPRPRARFEPELFGEKPQAVEEDYLVTRVYDSQLQSTPSQPVDDFAQLLPRKMEKGVLNIPPASTISSLSDAAFLSAPATVTKPEASERQTVLGNDQSDATSSPAFRPFRPAESRSNPVAEERRSLLAQSADRQILSQSKRSTPAEPSTPTINVTIGRVEVRAVTPSQTQPKNVPQRPNPPLSLDDYLAQRKEGKP